MAARQLWIVYCRLALNLNFALLFILFLFAVCSLFSCFLLVIILSIMPFVLSGAHPLSYSLHPFPIIEIAYYSSSFPSHIAECVLFSFSFSFWVNELKFYRFLLFAYIKGHFLRKFKFFISLGARASVRACVCVRRGLNLISIKYFCTFFAFPFRWAAMVLFFVLYWNSSNERHLHLLCIWFRFYCFLFSTLFVVAAPLLPSC